MGKPKFSRKKYETPSHPWQADRIKAENELSRKYGLKNKREIWKAQTALRRYRGQARGLLAKIGGDNPQVKKESEQLLMRLTRMNILPLNSTLDDVLALETEPILSRRLQTLTYLKGLANTPTQARQLISHGHIAIADRRITVPSYMVTKDEESKIGYAANSPLNDLLHPARPSAEFKSVPIKKEDKPEESKDKSTGGKERTKEHIEETVKTLNSIDPDFIRIRTFLPKMNTPILEEIQNGIFQILSPHEVLKETYKLIKDLKVTCQVYSDHYTNYIHFAEQYYNQYKKSWIHDALRSHNFVRGQHQGKTRVWQNKATLLSFSPRRDYGPAEI